MVHGAGCVKDDLVVLPKALEEPQGSAIAVAVLRCKLQNFGQSSVPVDGAVQPVLERVDRANKISKAAATSAACERLGLPSHDLGMDAEGRRADV